MKDEQKSKALQACRLLIEVFESGPWPLMAADFSEPLRIAREVVVVRKNKRRLYVAGCGK